MHAYVGLSRSEVIDDADADADLMMVMMLELSDMMCVSILQAVDPNGVDAFRASMFKSPCPNFHFSSSSPFLFHRHFHLHLHLQSLQKALSNNARHDINNHRVIRSTRRGLDAAHGKV
jgi:hypothetical protein